MAYLGDPFRVLGLAPGASLNEIRSAYRRLAKQYHPDAAGERALPRFLAIQAAYERLVDAEGRLRPPSAPAGRGSGARRSADASDPWRADAARARASREAWRARRAGAADGAAQERAGRTTRDRAGGQPGGAGGGTAERPGRRGPRKATPGSTTYDEAKDVPLDPEWEGGAWYGPSSRTYWTINPREYADPRKHGPEYQARARRAAEQEAAADADGPPAGDEASPSASDATWDWSADESTTTDGGSSGWGTHGWSYEAQAESGAAPAAPAAPSGSARPAAGEPDPLPDLEAVARRAAPRSLLALALHTDRRWRLVLALIGWPPIGYAVGTLLSTVSGCATYSAACPEPLPVLTLAIQPLVVALLFVLPPAAAVAAFASIVALAVAVPVAAVLSVGSGPEPRAAAPILGLSVVVSYLVGLIAGAVAVWRPRPEVRSGGG